jgi:alkylation response protein AidB-like acyl-CoA dehydrogenase
MSASSDPETAEDRLRGDVRSFLRERLSDFAGKSNGTRGFDPAFSRELGRRGWIGSRWPRAYGGREAGLHSRFVILEEMLAAGAPVLAHMVGERQSGPLLLRYGTEAQRMRYLPRIAAGECYFCIGMSEPDAGSDLAAIRMKAVRVDGGYELNGTKIWTSLAHLCDCIIVLCRTSPMTAERHAGMSQLIVDLHSAGVSISPIINLAGEHEFNQVFFDDVFVPDEGLIGAVGAGWMQALSELTNERGGPDRYLSNFAALQNVVMNAGPEPSERAAIIIGRLVAHLFSLRQLGKSVAGREANGEDPTLQAVLVKVLGAAYEQDAIESLRQLVPLDGSGDNAVLEEAVTKAPSYSIRGGSREILLSLIADGLLDGK